MQGSYKLIRCSRLCEWDLLISTWVVSVFLYEKVANNCYCKKWPPSANWVTWVICDKIWCFLQVHTKWQIYQYGAKTTYKEFAGVKEYIPFSDKGEEKKIKPHTNRTKRCFFRSLTSLVAYGQLRAWMVRKKSELRFFPLI